MLQRIAISISILLLAWTTSMPSAQAALMTFNGIADEANAAQILGAYSEAGFSMSGSNGEMLFVDNDFNVDIGSFDDDVAGIAADGAAETYTIVADGGFAFDALSLVVGQVALPGTLTVRGLFDGGGSISEVLTGCGIGCAETIALTGFNNLLSLEFESGRPFMVFDDVELRLRSAVPAPSTFSVLLGGLFALIALMRRARSR